MSLWTKLCEPRRKIPFYNCRENKNRKYSHPIMYNSAYNISVHFKTIRSIKTRNGDKHDDTGIFVRLNTRGVIVLLYSNKHEMHSIFITPATTLKDVDDTR